MNMLKTPILVPMLSSLTEEDSIAYGIDNMLPHEIPIKLNDTIETGGMSSIFPKNIPIGTIKSFNLPTGLNYYEITVKLFEDIGSIQNVYVVKYNFKKPIIGFGSAIFIHLTKDYKPTAGCIALSKKDFLIMLKLINKNTKLIIP